MSEKLDKNKSINCSKCGKKVKMYGYIPAKPEQGLTEVYKCECGNIATIEDILDKTVGKHTGTWMDKEWW